MQPLEYYLTYDFITIFTNPEVVIRRDNHVYKKICNAIANNDWTYVHGLVAIAKQESQTIEQPNSDLTIINGQAHYKGENVNNLIGVTLLKSFSENYTQQLKNLEKALEDILSTHSSDVASDNDVEKEKDIELSVDEEEMFKSLKTAEDETILDSWSGDSWNDNSEDSWGNNPDDYPVEGVFDGGSFK